MEDSSLSVLESFFEVVQGVRFRQRLAQSEQSLIQFLSQAHCTEEQSSMPSDYPSNPMGKHYVEPNTPK